MDKNKTFFLGFSSRCWGGKSYQHPIHFQWYRQLFFNVHFYTCSLVFSPIFCIYNFQALFRDAAYFRLVSSFLSPMVRLVSFFVDPEKDGVRRPKWPLTQGLIFWLPLELMRIFYSKNSKFHAHAFQIRNLGRTHGKTPPCPIWPRFWRMSVGSKWSYFGEVTMFGTFRLFHV